MIRIIAQGEMAELLILMLKCKPLDKATGYNFKGSFPFRLHLNETKLKRKINHRFESQVTKRTELCLLSRQY